MIDSIDTAYHLYYCLTCMIYVYTGYTACLPAMASFAWISTLTLGARLSLKGAHIPQKLVHVGRKYMKIDEFHGISRCMEDWQSFVTKNIP